ncbi:integrase catalytic domain-containing protein [Trichonephila clavipes]|nr:integrase catalytic domain-containing protein [Trichonephila clavipes]
MADDAMNKLKKKRASVRTTITKTVKNIETEINKPEVSVDALEELLEHIKIYSEDLNAINTQIENAVDITELDNELKSATEYQDKIITWTFRAGKKIRELSKNNSTEISTTSKVTPEVLTQNFVPEKANVKLPKLTINHFYGDNSQWLTFWNTFETAIHKNESLDKITKFNYLRTYLKGSALNSIDGLSITPENYDAAIEILISRFGKKNILINTHMNNLFRIPPLKNARDPVLFRIFFDQVQSEIRSLKSLGINSETYDVMDQEKICVSIPKISNPKIINKIKNSGILASDICFNENMCLYENDPNEIHMLIGADFAGRLLTGEIKQITENLVAIHTRLGWTLMGESGENSRRCETLLSLHVSDLDISELWRLDTIGIKDLGENQSKRELEEAAKLHFLENVKRDHEGRYMVGKLSDYEEVFNEWENEDIIEKVESHQEIDEEHYLPHRPVFKENSTTKVRPVFDGSAKEKNSPSINDCLEKGPNVIELIPSLINRFRFGKFGVIADIKKAFLQIGLQERDRPFLRFFWREKGKNDNITVYQHNRVVFGISSSPFLLGATIEFHLKNAPDHYKETAHTLLESFYVDNLVCSVNSKEKLDKLIVESQEILEEGKFELRGWEHNNLDPQTENTVPTERRSVPVLGLKWDLDQDLLSVDIKVHESKNEILTKRKILSLVHKIFDPIGFTCPVTLIPKIMLQECWTLRVKWDSELPASIWQKFQK